ncbi:DUF1572 domain-containing protein [Tenacibaculum sp. 190524A02b]|uniref:DUF1572 domain-containing protein n=1 Tax=Tenacibaculum vairaonense TaxID=3137860 RepID=UPI0031FA8CFF
MENSYLQSVRKQIAYYKTLGEKTFNQLTKDELFWQYNEESNSIAIIVKHIAGNMLSRWTDFFTEDGEKPWRNRDDEFVNTFQSKEELIDYWNKGWDCFINTINSIENKDLEKVIYIRNQGHTVIEAINRQICHYPYHIGQIVFLGKMVKNNDWKSLSIPKNASKKYNSEKFAKTKTKKHFTDDL